MYNLMLKKARKNNRLLYYCFKCIYNQNLKKNCVLIIKMKGAKCTYIQNKDDKMYL